MKEEQIEAEDFNSTEADKIRLAPQHYFRLGLRIRIRRVTFIFSPGSRSGSRREKEKNRKITTEKLQGNW